MHSSRTNPFVKTTLEAIQIGCIAWVLLHLILLIMFGTVVIAERRLSILIVETGVVSVGLFAGCARFLSTIKVNENPATA